MVAVAVKRVLHVNQVFLEADGLPLDGKTVHKGEVISRHLYAGTMGGPHLHFEIRYYRPHDKDDETYYGARFPGVKNSDLTEPSTGPWSYGYWNPGIGYGFANPRNHGIVCD